MRVIYDSTVDAASLRLREVTRGEVQRTEMMAVPGKDGPQQIAFGFASSGELVSIEFLDASDILPAELLAASEPPDPH